jgi:hypothetical protein
VSLLSWLKRSGFTEAHATELATLDHRAAVVLQVAPGTMTLSAYGSGKTTALTLFKASLVDGRLADHSRQHVLDSKVRVLY